MMGLLRLLLGVLFFMLFGVIFLMLLLVGSVVVLAASIWALITGKRPDVSIVFSNILRTSRKFHEGNWPTDGVRSQSTTADVVDVQAREVRNFPSSLAGPPSRPD